MAIENIANAEDAKNSEAGRRSMISKNFARMTLLLGNSDRSAWKSSANVETSTSLLTPVGVEEL